MGPVEALRIAVSKEEEAIKMYQKFYAHYPNLKDTFGFLVNEEEKHKKLLEKRIYQATK